MMRADIAVKERLGISRQKAQQLIDEGCVYINGQVIHKPAVEVQEGDEIQVSDSPVLKYVGRGALKLEKALMEFNINVQGLTCLDIGASTGGFTDCLLQNGAAKVYALDVGNCQLDRRLRADVRVVSMENTDIRSADLQPVDFICMDVSFISVTKVLYRVYELLKPEAMGVILVKPQFEAGRKHLNKHGVVKDRSVHRHVLEEVISLCTTLGFGIRGLSFSPIRGGDGNLEYLLALGKGEGGSVNIDGVIKEAFGRL